MSDLSKQFVHKHLYSARIENHTKRPITVEGTYCTSELGDRHLEEKLLIPLKAGDAKTFAAKHAQDTKMHLVQFFVTDGENADKTVYGPFVNMDRDRETFVIEDKGDDLDFHLKNL